MKRWAVFFLTLGFVVLVIIALAPQFRGYDSRYKRIQVGMSKSDVVAIMGLPNQVDRTREIDPVPRETWGPSMSNYYYVVFFDEADRVKTKLKFRG